MHKIFSSNYKKILCILILVVVVISLVLLASKDVGKRLDTYNGVSVFYNGRIKNVVGRNVSADGYNIGLKYQCVEFVKRYYFIKLKHKMPNSWGHAKDFFKQNIKDGVFNAERGLLQFENGSSSKPEVDDIFVFKASVFNPFGHVAIVSDVGKESVEIVQQNTGFLGSTRERLPLERNKGFFRIKSPKLLGWLRLKE